jgi:hypothetical protein
MADNSSMGRKRLLTWNERMIQWIGVAIALIGFVWNGVKDYQKGEIKLPALQEKKELTKVIYPIQYCLMAYDPNVDKVFYKHEDGLWYDYAPEQRRYASSPQVRQYQGQNQTPVGTPNGPPRTPRYAYGQQTQTPAYTSRY